MSNSADSSFFIPVQDEQEEVDDNNEANMYFPDSSNDFGHQQVKQMDGTTLLDVFGKIMWMQAARDSQARNSVITMNLQIIYGCHLVSFKSLEQAVQYLNEESIPLGKILKMSQKLTCNFKAIPLYVVVCTEDSPELLQFQQSISKMQHVYQKCITLKGRPGLLHEKLDINEETVDTHINQVFDVIEAVSRIESKLIKQHEANTAKFYNWFNIDIETDIEEPELILSQQIKGSVKQSQDNKKQEQQSMSWCALATEIETKTTEQIMQSQPYIFMDPAQLVFIIVTDLETKQCLEVEPIEGIKIMTVSQLDSFIAQQEHTKIVMISTSLQTLEKYVANKHVWLWLRCQWNKSHLDESQLERYGCKYKRLSQIFDKSLPIQDLDSLQILAQRIQDIQREVEEGDHQ